MASTDPGPGLSNLGDQLFLWDSNDTLVDAVSFGDARSGGVTFISDPGCGQFGALSQTNVCGAVRAADDTATGSPGWALTNCRPSLSIRVQPFSQVVDAGGDVTFRLEACGLPRPGIQWFHNGVPRSSLAGAASSAPQVINYPGSGLAWTATPNAGELVLLGVAPADAGQYFAVVSNGLERATSAVVTLTVNTIPTPPVIQAPAPELRWPFRAGLPDTNLVVAPGQTARFAVLSSGYPVPTYQWSWSPDGVQFTPLAGATQSTLTIVDAQPSTAGVYRVQVENAVGAAAALARLTIRPKPRLRITEAMSSPWDGQSPTWWELTNTDVEPAYLYGFRWDDQPGDIGGGPTITNSTVIEPGESIILLEDRTPTAFIQEWGADNLPSHLRFILHSGNGLNENQDQIALWNPAATEKFDFVDRVEFAVARRGSSFWFDLDYCLESEFGIDSNAGDCGSFLATNGCDVGSPGWTRWTPPQLTSVQRNQTNAVLTWKAQPGSTNRLEFARQLASPPSATVWEHLGTYQFPHASCTALDTNIGGAQRFYRVNRLAPAPCPCP